MQEDDQDECSNRRLQLRLRERGSSNRVQLRKRERERETQQGAAERERSNRKDATLCVFASEREGKDRAKRVRPDATARIIEVNRNRLSFLVSCEK